MTEDKAIEIANKIQLSNNPLWVEIKRLGEMYDRREAELYSTNHELFDEGVEYLRKITDLEKKNAELEASLLDVSEKTVKQIKELESQIKKMKADVELARDNANKTENWETFNVLNSILDDWR